MNAQDLMAKALRAAESAKLLLDSGDKEGACDRAYYAMFNAARAALLASGAPVEPEIAKTHGGLISAFSMHLVKTGRVPIEYGRSLNRVEELRLIADYKGDPIEQEQAAHAVTQAICPNHAGDVHELTRQISVAFVTAHVSILEGITP